LPALKKGSFVFCGRNVPGGHNHGHASRNTPSPLGLSRKSKHGTMRHAFGHPSPCDCLLCAGAPSAFRELGSVAENKLVCLLLCFVVCLF
jgi:hypothetical protein